jgi:CheY-like chemotaxis protein
VVLVAQFDLNATWKIGDARLGFRRGRHRNGRPIVVDSLLLADEPVGGTQVTRCPFPSGHVDQTERVLGAALAELVGPNDVVPNRREVAGRVDLSKVVEQMLALLKVSVSKHAVMIADLAEELPAIPANPAQIRQIVMNLITNASDAIGDRDGVIRVITRRATLRESAALSQSLSEGDYLALEVSDTGSGMSPETQSRVFDPFFTTKSAGRGLGLAVVSGIVRSLGGRIRVKSKPGKGSKFQVLLPCTESTGAPTTASISVIKEPAGPFQDAVVLVVEDEDQLRQPLVKMLHKNGFKVLEAANGSAAINLLQANRGKIDVILLDMTIPGASSREVVDEAAKSRPDAKVVLTSAYGEEMLAPLMSESQIRGFIRKPFQFVDLTQILRNALLT